MMNLSFLGAAGTVTGSRHLLTAGSRRWLVDCGLFQGLKHLRLRNREPFPFDPASLDAVLLTHAHLDHTGALPLLVKRGFTAPIYCTEPTEQLTRILLADSGRLQEEDARYANKKGYARHAPAEPLYTEDDAHRATELLRPVPLGAPVELDGATVTWTMGGHILGAASVHVRTGEGSIVFSGDIGRPHDLLIPAPKPPPASDFVVMESTYGDREHPLLDPVEGLGLVLRRTVRRGGVLMIPAFAVGRAQLVLYVLSRLFARGTVPRVPVYLNSPMGIDVTELYLEFPDFHRLTGEEVAKAFAVAEYTRTVEESKAVNRKKGPMVLIAGAGMLTGGRIVHHLAAFGSDHRNTILLTGHQAAGTRGASLLGGAKHLRIHGRNVPIRAEVARLDGLSAHADRSELLDWLDAVPGRPRGVWLVHGEPESAEAFRRDAEQGFGARVQVAEDGRTVELV